MSKLTKSERAELVAIMQGKWNRKRCQIQASVEPQIDKELDKLNKEQHRITKAAKKAVKDALSDKDFKLVETTLSVYASGGHSRWEVQDLLVKVELKKQGLSDMEDKLAELPERLFVAAVTADGIEDIIKEFSSLD